MILPEPSKSFIYALSDFWATCFRDADELRAFLQGVELNVAQTYLELMEKALGTSLAHTPLFSKTYLRAYFPRRDQLFFAEGPSPADDRYVFSPTDGRVAGAKALTNRILAPTAVLSDLLDFEVSDGAFRFKVNPLDTDGAGTTSPLFPAKYVTVVSPATYADVLGRSWPGAKVGDSFRLRVLGGGTPRLVTVTGVEGPTLHLSADLPDFAQDFSRRTVQAAVVRTPYDAKQTGVLLPAQPRLSTRMSASVADAVVVNGTKNLSFAGEPYYKGSWAAATAYDEGDLVMQGGELRRNKTAHVSGVAFEAARWDVLAGNFLYVHTLLSFANDGMYRVSATASPGVVTLDRPTDFDGSLVTASTVVLVAYDGPTGVGPQAVQTLQHTYVDADTFVLTARRAHPVTVRAADGTPWTYEAGEPVLLGVDYLIDGESGTVTALTGWSPTYGARATYTWMRLVCAYGQTRRGAWTAFTAYGVGDLVTSGGVAYVCKTAHTSGGAFDATKFTAYVNPFASNVSRQVRQIAAWATDALVDEDALFETFGYLLDYQKPSSEQYRAFLRGVAQLFLLGPAVERFESAMNVMAGFPVVRDDGEVLRAFDDGIEHAASDGEFIDTASGRTGVLDAGTSGFSDATARFYASDVGATIRRTIGDATELYVITAVTGPTTVTVAPTPPDATAVTWRMEHVFLTRRFRAASGTFEFAPDDAGAFIVTKNSPFARNNGARRILSVEDAVTVVLDSPYGFDDETGVDWQFSPTGEQVVTTSARRYVFPLGVLMRPDVADPDNFNVLTFKAFEALSEAFRVVDYIRDPTWWHHVVIPHELLSLETESSGRRQVSPELIEHVYGALDGAIYGDFGMAHGVDDEGESGIARAGTINWFGGDSVVLAFGAGVPRARIRDVGQCLVLTTPGFEGFFPIEAVSLDGNTLRLGRFPPPETLGTIPPVALTGNLPPLLWRRTVAFVMMDRFMKFHAVQLRIEKNTPLPPDFVADVTRLIGEAKPAHTYIFLEAMTDFRDELEVDESMGLGLGVPTIESLYRIDNALHYGGIVRYGDAFRYTSSSTSISGSPGTYALPVSLPSGDVQATLVKVRFDPAVLVNAGARRPAEELDYTVNYATGAVTILPTSSFPAGPNLVRYIHCVRRLRSDVDALDATETRIAVAGTDPTTVRAPGQAARSMGLVDRAVQITLGP